MIVATRFSQIQTRDTTRVEQQGSFHLKVKFFKKSTRCRLSGNLSLHSLLRKAQRL